MGNSLQGLGGAIHASAGGELFMASGTVIDGNSAADSGGGLSVKSAVGQLTGPITIQNNAALGDATYGNGGGAYVTTSFYDSTDPNSSEEYAGQGAATLYGDGQISASSENVVMQDNGANRWGGGVYVGSPVTSSLFPQIDSIVTLTNIVVRFNTASVPVTSGSVTLLPTQIAIENVDADEPAPTFDGSIISGNSASTDIGIYSLDSQTPSTNGVVFTAGSLYVPLLEQ